ncbi:TPA: hypothetical protein ACF012_004513, partial [Escherichia coli]
HLTIRETDLHVLPIKRQGKKSLKLDEKFVGHVLAIYIPLTKIGIPRLLGRGFTVKRNKTPFSL